MVKKEFRNEDPSGKIIALASLIVSLFIDGESVKSYHSSQYRRLAGNVSSVRAFSSEPGLQGNVFVDNLAFFETGFSPYEIKGLYNDGLDKFLETMPVNPQGRLATTWGQLKSR